jgi:predicted GNAT superfamily acetyltransferase
MKGETYNGVLLGQDGRFKPTRKEETKVLGIRLPVSMVEQINQVPNKSDWLKDVLSKALENRTHEN